MSWKLKRTEQCSKCPWRVDTDPYDIPNGYDVEKHEKLEGTIAKDLDFNFNAPMRVMACHEMHDAHCIGWLKNQMGPGNNIRLRMAMRECENAGEIVLHGKQHERFEDTLPEK
jgi:hypothetical protein